MRSNYLKNLAIITARSGSKGLPDKNIKLLSGKPLMSYTIEAAYESDMFDEVFVSTDSEKYAEIARKCGARVPFLRSERLANDTASSWDVVRETLVKYKEIGKRFETIALLQPTSPLRRAEDIVMAYRIFQNKKSDSVISVCEMEHSPLLCNQLGEDGLMQDFVMKDNYLKPRQELSKYYRINGAIYIVRTRCNIDICDLYNEKSYAYIMPQERSIDIDTQLDFEIAKSILNNIVK